MERGTADSSEIKGEPEKDEGPGDVRPGERAGHGRSALGCQAKLDSEAPTVQRD
jgi:hypothetical protein